ncbi:MAG TPA: NUDIX domain-containing protein, partial [Elusimicrobiota bacterium]|nr:NUDIX domain-containing protein [Elusimicrobiota bacterium]
MPLPHPLERPGRRDRQAVSPTYPWPRPGVTADSVVLGRDRRGGLHVLAIRRKNPPFKGRWCLPGGFVDMGESLERA